HNASGLLARFSIACILTSSAENLIFLSPSHARLATISPVEVPSGHQGPQTSEISQVGPVLYTLPVGLERHTHRLPLFPPNSQELELVLCAVGHVYLLTFPTEIL